MKDKKPLLSSFFKEVQMSRTIGVVVLSLILFSSVTPYSVSAIEREEQDQVDLFFHQNLEYILTKEGFKSITPVDSVIVDAVQNAAPMNAAPGCGAEWAMLYPNDYGPGLYGIAISDGPGISGGGDYDVGCFVLISGPEWYLGGLHGIGSVDDKRSFVLFNVNPGETRQVHLCVADGDCTDNAGYVEVTLYQIGN